MLPARSTRYVGLDGEIPRLHLVSGVQLSLIALLVLVLFGLLFSPTSLVERIYAQNEYDGLTLSYLKNLYRSNPHNADVAILLARTQQEEMTVESLESVLQEFTLSADVRQRKEVRLILLKAYQRLADKDIDMARRQAIKPRQRALVLQEAADEPVDPRTARLYAEVAFSVGLPTLGVRFLRQVDPKGNPLEELVQCAQRALGNADYEVASLCFMAARAMATELPQARDLFMRGVDALMAKSLFAQAMKVAAQELGDLDSDAQTLRYLVRVARAAGDAEQTARYAWLLVARPTGGTVAGPVAGSMTGERP
jgi:hypothetical protein